jgi:hypothetical protein
MIYFIKQNLIRKLFLSDLIQKFYALYFLFKYEQNMALSNVSLPKNYNLTDFVCWSSSVTIIAKKKALKRKYKNAWFCYVWPRFLNVIRLKTIFCNQQQVSICYNLNLFQNIRQIDNSIVISSLVKT